MKEAMMILRITCITLLLGASTLLKCMDTAATLALPDDEIMVMPVEDDKRLSTLKSLALTAVVKAFYEKPINGNSHYFPGKALTRAPKDLRASLMEAYLFSWPKLGDERKRVLIPFFLARELNQSIETNMKFYLRFLNNGAIDKKHKISFLTSYCDYLSTLLKKESEAKTDQLKKALAPFDTQRCNSWYKPLFDYFLWVLKPENVINICDFTIEKFYYRPAVLRPGADPEMIDHEGFEISKKKRRAVRYRLGRTKRHS